MAQSHLNIRMDSELKTDFNTLCESIGMSMSTAICIFAKKAVTEQRIPFDLTVNDPFYSPENIAELERRISDVRTGKSILKEHELIEVDDDE